MSAVLEQAVSNVKRLFHEGFHGGDSSVASQVLTEDFVFQYPFPGFSAGPEGIVEFSQAFQTGFPGFELEIHDLFGSLGHHDTHVSIRWTMRGSHDGDFLGLPATNKYVTMSAIGYYNSPWGTGGQLSAGWLEMDALGKLQQLGVVPPTDQLLPGLRDK